MTRVTLLGYLRLSLALLLALALLLSLAAPPAMAERPSDHQYKPRDNDNNDNDRDKDKNRHKKRDNNNRNNGGGGGGVFEISQSSEQEGEAGDVDQSFTVTSEGDNSTQCAGLQGVANSGNSQNVIDLTQVNAEADDFEFEEVGSSIEESPESSTECNQRVNQAAAASASADSCWTSGGWNYCYWTGWGTYYWDPYSGQWVYWSSYPMSTVSDVAAGALGAASGTVPLLTLGALALVGTTGALIRRGRRQD